jgi:hypothetical protein
VGPAVQGRVERVDPAGFTKVSALGIEEQRVRTTIDFNDPPAKWSLLGHDYRVIVHVTIWKADDVLTVPVGCLVPTGGRLGGVRGQGRPCNGDYHQDRSAKQPNGGGSVRPCRRRSRGASPE